MDYQNVERLFKQCRAINREIECLRAEIEYSKKNRYNVLLPVLEERLSQEEKIRLKVEDILSTLPPESSLLMRLYYIEKQSSTKVAYKMHMSEKTFARRKKRILQELQEKNSATINSMNL